VSGNHQHRISHRSPSQSQSKRQKRVWSTPAIT
jgi:hypothetical protein